jgi:hypothetical protein
MLFYGWWALKKIAAPPPLINSGIALKGFHTFCNKFCMITVFQLFNNVNFLFPPFLWEGVTGLNLYID